MSADRERRLQRRLHLAECVAHVLNGVIVGVECGTGDGFNVDAALDSIESFCGDHVAAGMLLLAASLRDLGVTPEVVARTLPEVVAEIVTGDR